VKVEKMVADQGGIGGKAITLLEFVGGGGKFGANVVLQVGEELSEMGIPKEDIILGLHPPYKRPYSNYGVA